MKTVVDWNLSGERDTCDVIDRQHMNIVIVGHVDHGKSTIIGRLLVDTGCIPEGKLERVRHMCRQRGKPFEYAFLLDALKDEQAQGITIDSARTFFKSEKRDYMIVDAPGHTEFLKNMVSGAARADAALLVIDSTEGIQDNSKRHGYLLSMLGIEQIAVLVNKMDLVGYDERVYRTIARDYTGFLQSIGVEARGFIPVSGVNGDNLVKTSPKTPWYDGSPVLTTLDAFCVEPPPTDRPFRMPVQDVYRFAHRGDTRRIVAGTVETGRLKVGDEVTFYPSGKTSRVKTIESFPADQEIDGVGAGDATGFTLEEQIYVKRGEIATVTGEMGCARATHMTVNVFWLGQRPLVKYKRYVMKLGTARVEARLEYVHEVLDATNLTRNIAKDRVDRYDVAKCTLSLASEIACDTMDHSPSTARFVIVDDDEISGGGLVVDTSSRSDHLHAFSGLVTYEDRCRILGQPGIVVWLTGLSASGKSTIAGEVEKILIGMGRSVYRLDGDNIRRGLGSDLGFSARDRDENVRRIAEVAALFQDAGMITLVAAISPFRRMRAFARETVGDDQFIEVYVKATVEACERRDPKGLYAKARRGDIKDFTGISSPYEVPETPDLVVNTEKRSVTECARRVVGAVIEKMDRQLLS